jgi:hypothetical protein
VIRLLEDLLVARATALKPTWMLCFRSRIRGLGGDMRAVLSAALERSGDPSGRLLVIWLRGRCGGSLGTSCLVRFSQDPNARIRREVARALKRMGAWGPLREMAATDPDPRIRRMATVRPPRPYSSRLQAFTRHCVQRVPRVRASRLFLASEIGGGVAKPPKSATLIRDVLRRIQRLVRGVRASEPPSPDRSGARTVRP